MIKFLTAGICIIAFIHIRAQTFNLRERYNRLSAVNTSVIEKDGYLYSTGYCEDSINANGIMSYLCKYSVDGQLVKIRYFKIPGCRQTAIHENTTIEKSDGSFLSAGYTVDSTFVTRCMIVNFDTGCSVLFYKEYTEASSQTFFGLRLVESISGYFIQGTLQKSNFDVNLFLIHTDFSGNEQWRKYYGSNSTDEMAAAFVKTSSNRLLIAAQRNNRKYSDEHLFKSWSYLLLLDTAGNIVRDTVGEDENMGIPQSLIETQDGNFVYCTNYYVGKSQWLGYFTKGYVAKVDSNLNTLWEGKFGDSSTLTGLRNIVELSTGELVAVGTNYDATYTSTSDYHNNGLVIKLDAQGTQLWRHDYRGVTRIGQQLEDNVLHDCEVLSDGSIIACGVAQDNNDTFPQQAWLLRINADGCMDDGFCGYTGVDEVEKETRKQTILKVYPNPANNQLNIRSQTKTDRQLTFEMLNALGQVVKAEQIQQGMDLATFDVKHLPAGIYFWRLKDVTRSMATGKVSITR